MKYLPQLIVTAIMVSCVGINSATAAQSYRRTRANTANNNYHAYKNDSSLLEIVNRYEGNLSCTTSLSFNPLGDRYQILVHKGIALQKLQKYRESIVCLNKALSLQPQSERAWYRRGIALSYLNNYTQAYFAYNRALQIDPNDYTAWYNQAITLEKLGIYNLAISDTRSRN